MELVEALLLSEVTHNRSGDCTADHCVKEETKEVLVVVQADAVTYPGTMVVHTKDTAAAD